MDRFKSLYIINKSSKKYRNIGGNLNQQRKRALYNLKHKLINRWLEDFERVEIHNIDGNRLLYFKNGDYGYHAPIEKFNLERINISESKKINNFYSSPVNSTDRSEREALQYIKSEIGLNVNNHLPKGHDPSAEWGLIY